MRARQHACSPGKGQHDRGRTGTLALSGEIAWFNRQDCLSWAIGLVQAEAESILFNASFILFTLFHTV